MQFNKALPAIVLVFVWLLIWDNFLSGILMGSAMAQFPGMRADYPKMWEIVGDFFSALVLVWVYDRVRGAFPAGAAGGAVFGVYAGILINFPTWLFMTVYAGWPYRATWHVTLMLIVLTIVSGTLAGVVYQKVSGTRSA